MSAAPVFRAAPVRIPSALAAGLALLSHKEDTDAAHRFATSLDGRSMERHFCLFQNSLADANTAPIDDLLAILSDTDRLANMPANTLGHHYARYIIANNLDLPEFIEQCIAMHQACDAADDVSPAQQQWFMMNNICHDLFHVVGGYGIDALGELCVQAFFSSQSGSRAARLLAAIGSITAQIVAPRVPVLRMVHSAYMSGERAAVFALIDWADMLGRPLADVRHMLKVEPNPLYDAVPPAVRDAILASQTG